MMLSTIWSKKRTSTSTLFSHGSNGLRLLTTLANSSSSSSSSNVVIKPIFLLASTNPTRNIDSCCYLKSCHLCCKPLTLDKEIYMYRGDLGFCSVECRDRQIYVDEMKEIEASTHQMLRASRRRRDAAGRCEAADDFRNRHLPLSSAKNRVIFS